MNSGVKKGFASEWRVPTMLIVLSAIPVAAGMFRLVELTLGADVTPDNARFFASPLPVLLHIVSVTLYSLLGAFQFAPGFRRRRSGWHRAAGRLLVPCGLAAALSGLWMAHFYPWSEYDGELLYGLRLFFGSAMVLSLLLGAAAIWRRDFARHGAWMIRAYALALGAGTQVFTHLPWFLFPSIQGELARALSMGAGWVINLAVAEWVIRTRLTRSAYAPPRSSQPDLRISAAQSQNTARERIDMETSRENAEIKTAIDRRALLSTLWIFLLFNTLFRDFHELFRAGMVGEIMTGVVGGTPITDELMLLGGVMVEIPILMVLLSRVLAHRANRWANLFLAPVTTVIMLQNGVNDLDDIFFIAVETFALSAIVWVAWRWRAPVRPGYSVIGEQT